MGGLILAFWLIMPADDGQKMCYVQHRGTRDYKWVVECWHETGKYLGKEWIREDPRGQNT